MWLDTNFKMYLSYFLLPASDNEILQGMRRIKLSLKTIGKGSVII